MRSFGRPRRCRCLRPSVARVDSPTTKAYPAASARVSRRSSRSAAAPGTEAPSRRTTQETVTPAGASSARRSASVGISWMRRPTVPSGSERMMLAVAGSPVSSATTVTSEAPGGQSKRTPWSSRASASPGRAAQAQIAALPSISPVGPRWTTKSMSSSAASLR